MTEPQKVRVGYMPQALADRDYAVRLLDAIESAGLDHVGVGDHVSFHGGVGFDGLVNATALMMLNPRLPIHTAVYLLPLRHPLVVARQISSQAQLAPGRLVLGVGIGGEDPREVANCGVDLRTRGRRANECLEVLRPLLAGETVSYEGEFFRLDDARIVPAPQPAPPVLVGGRSDAAISRAGRYADGWLGLWVTYERWCAALELFTRAANAAKRTLDAPRHGLLVWCGTGETREAARRVVASRMELLYQTPFERFEKYTPYGTPSDIADFLLPFARGGVTDFELTVAAEDEWEAVEAAGEIRRLLHARA